MRVIYCRNILSLLAVGAAFMFLTQATQAQTTSVSTERQNSIPKIDGAVIVKDVKLPCTASIAGTLRYHNKKIEFCNGKSWAVFPG